MEGDYYALLGVNKNASEFDIRQGYRKQAILWHPDKNPTKLDESTKIFRLISEAYEVLKDPEKRKTYDLYGHTPFKLNGVSSPFPNPRPKYVPKKRRSYEPSFRFQDPFQVFRDFFDSKDPFSDLVRETFFGGSTPSTNNDNHNPTTFTGIFARPPPNFFRTDHDMLFQEFIRTSNETTFSKLKDDKCAPVENAEIVLDDCNGFSSTESSQEGSTETTQTTEESGKNGVGCVVESVKIKEGETGVEKGWLSGERELRDGECERVWKRRKISMKGMRRMMTPERQQLESRVSEFLVHTRDKPVTARRLLKTHLQGFLASRGMKKTGLKDELIERVKETAEFDMFLRNQSSERSM